jgi:hypothetical protein
VGLCSGKISTPQGVEAIIECKIIGGIGDRNDAVFHVHIIGLFAPEITTLGG